MTILITPEEPSSLTDLPPGAALNTLPLSPEEFAPDQTLVLTGSPDSGSLQLRIAAGAVGSCEPVPA